MQEACITYSCELYYHFHHFFHDLCDILTYVWSHFYKKYAFNILKIQAVINISQVLTQCQTLFIPNEVNSN